MTKSVTISHYYDASPTAVWGVATDLACFARAMKGVATFEGMPSEGQLRQGQKIDVKVRLFGWMPPMDYHMELKAFDPDGLYFTSSEQGGSIRHWQHHLTVTAEGSGSRLTDHVTIDAGLFTGLMCLWAKFIYRRRHTPRLEMLSEI